MHSIAVPKPGSVPDREYNKLTFISIDGEEHVDVGSKNISHGRF